MKKTTIELDLEVMREPLLPAFDYYNIMLNEACETLAWDIYHNGSVTESMKETFLDNLMAITAWLSEQYEKAAAVCDIELPKGFTDDLQRHIIESVIKVTEKMIAKVEDLIFQQGNEDPEGDGIIMS